MGRRRAVDAVVSGADSSPSSAESSFRELDDVFLQTQTRIWLGEVLNTRLNAEIHMSDLLADGELLFELSKLVWNMLLVKCAELRHLKAYQHPLRSRKSSGRYMPYSNVDSFLKICKVLGLDGIDLFSPSDVVEKRDTRKVCICIRALSKKVPDFDVVSYAVAMPTDMVGCIRRSLESSQCSFSSSSSYNSFKDSRSKIYQKNPISECDGNYDSASDVSDEVESKYCGLETYCSSENKFDNPATLDLETEILSDVFSVVKLNPSKKILSQPEMRRPYRSEFGNGEPKSASVLESVNSFSILHSENDNDSDNLSSCHMKSQMNLHTRNSHNGIRQHCGNTLELADVDLALLNDNSAVGDSLLDNVAERDFISDYLAFSDSVVFGTDGSSPIIFDGEDNICNFFMGIDSHQSGSNWKNRFCQKPADDMEDVEVSSTASMSSILGRVLNMDFEEQFDVGDSSTMRVEPTVFRENEADRQDGSLFVEDQIQDMVQFETLSHSSATDIKESQHEMNLGIPVIFTDFFSTCHNQGQPSTMGSQKHERNGSSQIHAGEYKFTEQKPPGFPAISSGNISEAGHQESTDHNKKIIDYSEHTIEKDCTKHKNLASKADVLDGRRDPSSVLKEDKRCQRPLLKTVIGGTALVGVLFLLLHISRRGQDRTDVQSKQLNQTQKFRGAKSSSRKGQSGRPNGSYPAEKLKFGS